MGFLIKLRILLRSKDLIHNFFLIAFSVALLYLTFSNWWYGILLLIYLGYLYHQDFSRFELVVIIIIIYTIIISINYFKDSNLSLGKYDGKATIYEISKREDYAKVILKINGEKVLWNSSDLELRSGMVLEINGEIKEVFSARVPYGFNEKNYLKYQRIYRKIIVYDYQILKQRSTIFTPNEMINDYYDRHFDEISSSYLKALVIGNKNDLDDFDKKRIGILGISHLFVVSGLHIGLLISLMQKVLSLLKVSQKHQTIITFFFLTIYLILTAFLLAVVRVFVGEVLKRINKKWGLDLDPLDLLSINFLIVAFVLPLAPFQYAFILTYLTTFSITAARIIIYKYNNTHFGSAIISVVTFLITFPIIINISGEINFLSIIYNIFYIPLVSFIILPISLFISFLPFLSPFYLTLVKGFSATLDLLSRISFLRVKFPVPNFLVYTFYYILLLKFLGRWEKDLPLRKVLVIFIIFLVVYQNARFFHPFDEVTFLDLREGDATYIGKRFNQVNILIDTGETNNVDLFAFLKGKGVNTIHYLILTHSDSDHAGQASEIIEQFNVHNLIINAYDDNDNINQITSQLGKTKLIKVKEGDILNINKDIIFKVISPGIDYQDTNNNSLVMIGEVFGLSYLFTGDISTQVEKELIKKYDLSVDVLKVAHHGSNTSSSEDFLKNTNARVAIIMSGSHNPFGFPKPQVVKRLKENIDMVLSTSDYYTISITRNWYTIKIKGYNENATFGPLSGDP
ncbi:MAG: DNA internalization-related competence protein ComEC/Rec2 [Bacilli bacterium]|nr:DNA internalization-related competence protein ComEC/Rec2 [Acholeplasmataceae bacterium]